MSMNKYLSLVAVNFIYACTSIFTKLASQHEFLSAPFLLYVSCAIGVMGIYAFLWQQVISRMPLSTAYMFKGLSLVFVLLFSLMIFGESITLGNVLGSIIIIAGIVLFARL